MSKSKQDVLWVVQTKRPKWNYWQVVLCFLCADGRVEEGIWFSQKKARAAAKSMRAVAAPGTFFRVARYEGPV